jgi:hypothetical protein
LRLSLRLADPRRRIEKRFDIKIQPKQTQFPPLEEVPEVPIDIGRRRDFVVLKIKIF